MARKQDVEGRARRPSAAALRGERRCAEPLDLQDVPLLGYDGAPSTQRHLRPRRHAAATISRR